MRFLRVLSVALAALSAFVCSACSSSSSPGLTDNTDADGPRMPPDGSVKVTHDAGRDGHDGSHSTGPGDATLDSHVSTLDVVTGQDALLTFPDSSPYDAFTFPEAAIPHDSGGGDASGLPPCASLPDESVYCAAATDGGSAGYYTCMQGNGVYHGCSPSTVCTPLDAGGVACETP
jgi:hypothetical protein